MKNYTKMTYVIDMVKGFVTKGALHDEYIATTIDDQIELMKKAKKENEGVGIVKECHTKDCLEFKAFPPHCIEGTDEAEIVDELKEFEEDALIYLKNSTSALFAPNLVDDLAKMPNLKEIIVCGCCTDICVLNFVVPLKNYFNQIGRDINIIVVESATQTYGAPWHDRDEYNEMAYKLMKQAGIVVVKDLKELEKVEKELNTQKRGR